jgi:hypothetical protein
LGAVPDDIAACFAEEPGAVLQVACADSAEAWSVLERHGLVTRGHDPSDRRRALDFEEFFDTELGPHLRLAWFHELLTEPVYSAAAYRAMPFDEFQAIVGSAAEP